MYLNADIFSLIRENKNKDAKSVIVNFNLGNIFDVHKRSLLHHAAKHGNQEMTQYLLAIGYNVNAKDLRGNTPLIEALRNQHNLVAETLLRAGADPLISNKEKKSALHFLFAQTKPTDFVVQSCFAHFRRRRPHSSVKAAKSLIDAGCKVYLALYTKDARIIEYLLQQGCSLDYVHPNHAEVGFTILHASLGLYDLGIMKVLLDYGADPNAVDVWGRTILYSVYKDKITGSNHETRLLRLLLDAGVKTMSIWTHGGVFQCANVLKNGTREDLRLLIESGLDFSAQDPHGRNVLHYLAFNRNQGIVEELKIHANRLNVNAIDTRKGSPLHPAAFCANTPMLQFLLEQKGTEVNSIKGVHMKPILPCAYEKSFKPDLEYQSDRCVDMLLRRNADAQFDNDEDHPGMTIFDLFMMVKKNSRWHKLKPVVAHLALQDKLGTEITELIKSKINSQLSLKVYLQSCQAILDEKIIGNVTIFKLLAANEKKISKYLNNQELVQKLIRLSRDQGLTSSFPYYSSTLRDLFIKGMAYRTLKKKAAEVISKCSNGWLAKDSIVTDRLIDWYLNKEDLLRLYEL